MKKLNSKELIFEEEGHKYTINGKELISVTTFIGSLFNPFDAKGLARTISDGFKSRNYAKFKRGEKLTDEEKKKATIKYWIKAWKEKAEYGTLVHEELENYLKDGKEIRDPLASFGLQYIKDNNIDSMKVYPEAKLYSEKWGLAGTIDLLAIGDDKVIIGDWKTNNKFTVKAYDESDYGVKESTKHLSNSKINIYALQLMIYAYILKTEYGITPSDFHIIHLSNKRYTVYAIDYDEDLVLSILEEKIR